MSSSALTQIANALQNGIGIDLNLTGYTWEAPAYIGSQTPNSSIFTTIGASNMNLSTLTLTQGLQSTAIGTVQSNIANFTSAGISTLTATNGSFASLNVTQFSVGALTLSSINANAISAGTLIVQALNPSSINANAISAGTLTVQSLNPSSINANAISAGTLTVLSLNPSSLNANTISAGTLVVQVLNPSTLNVNTISSQLASISSINTNNLSTANMTLSRLTAVSVNTVLLNTTTISTGSIAASAISTTQFSTSQAFASTLFANTLSSTALNVNNIAVSTMNITNGFSNTGVTSVAEIVETLTVRSSLSGTTTFDWLSSAVWYLSSLTSNISASITNLPTTPNRSLVVTLIINQGATPYYASTLVCNGTLTPIRWASATVPTPTANRTEVESFTLFYIGSTWSALGQYTSFG